MRKGTDLPYIVHPEAVARLVEHYGGTPTMVAAAWLHDTVEDCGPDALARVTEACGVHVAELVLEVTNPPERGDRVLHLAMASPAAALVAACDKLHNMRSIISDGGRFERFKRGREIVIAYHTAVVPMLCWKIKNAALEVELKAALVELIKLP